MQLKRSKEDSLLRFHPWVFSGAIQQADAGIAEGEVVRVLTAGGDFIAVGHYQAGSIAVRILSFRDVEINDEFWYSRLESALRMRIAIGMADNPQNNTYRLVHGEGDLLPGLVIDVYGQTAVMQAHSVGMHICRDAIARQLVKVMWCVWSTVRAISSLLGTIRWGLSPCVCFPSTTNPSTSRSGEDGCRLP